MSLWSAAIALGVMFAVGAWLTLTALPSWSLRVAQRVAPQVTAVSDTAFRLAQAQRNNGWQLLADRVVGWIPNLESFRRELRRSGIIASETHSNGMVMLTVVLGLLLGVVIGYAQDSPLVGLVSAPTFAAGTYTVMYFAVARLAKRRVNSISREIPGLLELLSLSISAGESLTHALSRYTRSVPGVLSVELGHALRRVELGASVSDSLVTAATDVEVPQFTSAISQLTASIQQGAPIAGQLIAAAEDARESQRRTLMEAGGQKEIAMLFPLVFLILPVTVLFAVWPGLSAMNIGLVT